MIVSALDITRTERNRHMHDLVPQCPRCRRPMESAADDSTSVRCDRCRFLMLKRNGIWCALPIERVVHFSRFIKDYSAIRAAEGRGSLRPDYYLGLPYKDYSGNNKSQWKIRARTYSFLERKILRKLQETSGKDARVLDLGAGNGWMSYRMTKLGLRAVAVDLLVNDQDGLGAAKHYEGALEELFPRFQAESAKLPFADHQFDAVIYNASFHYAESYATLLREALRCLKAGGRVIIADSPWYSKESNGEQMLAERRRSFLKRYDTLSNSISSQEFLTDERLVELERIFGIRWERHVPSYGIQWALRPWLARLRRRREPATFRIYTAVKTV